METIYGIHPVSEALKRGRRRLKCVYLAKDKAHFAREIKGLARQSNVPLELISLSQMSRMLPGVKHQGVAAQTEGVPTCTLEELLSIACGQKDPPFLLYGDSIQDPHNLGAIIRSAEAAGCQGLILPARGSANLNATVAKTSAGAVEHLPITIVNNGAQALCRLKESGFWIVALQPGGDILYDETDLCRPIVVAVGSEGKGLRPALRKQADWLAVLPQCGNLNSLNASVAAAIMLYEVRRQRRRHNPL